MTAKAAKAEKTEVIPHDDQPQQELTVHEPTPLEIFHKAMDKGIDIEKMKVLKEMVEWHEGREAEKAFNKAMAGFRAESITILKDRHVKYRTDKGVTEYDHATLAAVLDAVVPALSKYGLSHRWEMPEQEGDKIVVSCIITHEQGHTVSTSLPGLPDKTGSKNQIQAVGSTVSYLQRYTFLAITGLAAKGMDDDGGNSAGDGAGDSYERISEDQIKKIKALLKDTSTDQAKFLEWCEVDSLKDIPSYNFKPCIDNLKRKKKLQEKQAEPA